jgi:hypothetical protein
MALGLDRFSSENGPDPAQNRGFRPRFHRHSEPHSPSRPDDAVRSSILQEKFHFPYLPSEPGVAARKFSTIAPGAFTVLQTGGILIVGSLFWAGDLEQGFACMIGMPATI